MNKKLIVIGLTTLAVILSILACSVNPTTESKSGLIGSILFFGFLCYYYTKNK